MPVITKSERVVFRSPTKGRDYLTAQAAARNEASAMIEKRYPTERADYDEFGRCTCPGYHWSSDEDLARLQPRLARFILRRFRAEQRANIKGE